MSFIIGGLGSLEVCFSRIDRAKKPELAKLRPFIPGEWVVSRNFVGLN